MPAASPARVSAASAVPRGFWLALALLLIGFGLPLFHLVRFSLTNDLHSHILLIPFVSLHALWGRRAALRVVDDHYPRFIAVAFFSLGALATVLHLWLRNPALDVLSADALVFSAFAFVLLLAGTCFWFFGKTAMSALMLPLLILGFTIPLPTPTIHLIETVLQHGSAAVAHQLFDLSGVSVFYHHLVFQLPGITLHVAPECSGIRSTLALLIVSVVTSYVFLQRPGHRFLIVLAVVPLALLRNGFRIFVIGELCMNYGPQMIESFIHRRGGPVFFALSLIPFFLLVVLLQRRERRAEQLGVPRHSR
jgi:exosortase C (VPDSG-CTERM-specific)